MAKVNTADVKPGIIDRLVDFVRDTYSELKKVTWPTMEDLKVSTKVTMFMLLVMAAITFGFDKVFELSIFTLLHLVSSS